MATKTVFVIIIFVISVSKAEEKRNINWRNVKKDIQNGIDGADGLVKGVQSNKMIDIGKHLTSIASLVPGPVGGVFAGVTAILSIVSGESDPAMVQISAQLSELAQGLRRISSEVEKAIHTIKAEVRSMPLKGVAAKLEVLQAVYERFVTENTTKAVADFKYSCKGIHETPIFLHSFTTQDPYGYKPVVMAENNETVYIQYIENVERLLFHATILEAACASLQYQNATKKEREIIRLRIASSSQNYLQNIKKMVDVDFKYYMFEAAKNIVEKLGPRDENEDNGLFGERVFDLIKNGLPSSKFYLVSYGGQGTYGPMSHDFDPWDIKTIRIETKPEVSFFHHWMRTWNRNVVLIRKGTDGPPAGHEERQKKCAEKFPSVLRPCAVSGMGDTIPMCTVIECDQWTKMTKQCLRDSGVSYIAIGCFHGWHFQRATFPYGKVYFTGLNYNWKGGQPHGRFVVV